MKQDRDPAEFNKAVEVIAAGLKHIDEAERLFNNHGRARDLLPAEVINRLSKLAALHKSGALTDEEFTAEKQKLLS
jgi:Short C-terminal domain